MPTPAPDRPISNDILLSLATAPLLLGLLAGKTAVNLVKSVSEASEELFRGDRLPFLDASLQTPTEPDESP